MGSHSRTKGKVGERECAAELAKHWNCTEARRSVQFCGDAGDADLKGEYTEALYTRMPDGKWVYIGRYRWDKDRAYFSES